MEMQGICRKCGQVSFVEAASQEQANLLVTERCDCEQVAKNKLALITNLRQLCGNGAAHFGFEPLKEETIDFLEGVCEKVVEGYFTQAKVIAGDTDIVIKATTNGFSVTRNKKRKATLEV